MLFSNLKILYVENELSLRDVMDDILSYEVDMLYFAQDGEEAYELYLKHKPHIIISSIDMPKLNGLEFVSKVRKTDHNTKIIMLTESVDTKFLLHATELKLIKYLAIPITGNQLYEALQLALDEINRFSTTTNDILNLPDGYNWDVQYKSLKQYSQEVHLTPKESQILNLLFSNLNATISYDRLFYEVWDCSEDYNIENVKTMIKNLRKKLPKDTIKNVYGEGFKVTI
ncbi:MAG TPA: response regulator transcription factor [Arcobacter sp.]|jgi:DNA-binding response OmpR family regulator|nr:response regulator transcription factor [Arcobacter sp.]